VGGVTWQVTQTVKTLFDAKAQRRKQILEEMENVNSAAEWEALARELDGMPGDSRLTDKAMEKLYDVSLLNEMMEENREFRETGNVYRLMFRMRGDLCRTVGNITNKCALHATTERLPLHPRHCSGRRQLKRHMANLRSTNQDVHPGLHVHRLPPRQRDLYKLHGLDALLTAAQAFAAST
jgi:hypothetical protein